MKSAFLPAACLAVVVFTAVSAGELSPGHREAALAYLEAKGTAKLLEKNCRLMLEKQLAAAPECAEHRSELEKFYLETFGFSGMKEDLIRLYAAEYTEAELRELEKFYRTELGKKSVAVEEKLVPAFARLLERRAAERVEAARHGEQ